MKIGIDLGGSHIALGVVDDKGYIEYSLHITRDHNYAYIVHHN